MLKSDFPESFWVLVQSLFKMSQSPGLFNEQGDTEVADQEADMPVAPTLQENVGNCKYLYGHLIQRRKETSTSEWIPSPCVPL